MKRAFSAGSTDKCMEPSSNTLGIANTNSPQGDASSFGEEGGAGKKARVVSPLAAAAEAEVPSVETSASTGVVVHIIGISSGTPTDSTVREDRDTLESQYKLILFTPPPPPPRTRAAKATTMPSVASKEGCQDLTATRTLKPIAIVYDRSAPHVPGLSRHAHYYAGDSGQLLRNVHPGELCHTACEHDGGQRMYDSPIPAVHQFHRAVETAIGLRAQTQETGREEQFDSIFVVLSVSNDEIALVRSALEQITPMITKHGLNIILLNAVWKKQKEFDDGAAAEWQHPDGRPVFVNPSTGPGSYNLVKAGPFQIMPKSAFSSYIQETVGVQIPPMPEVKPPRHFVISQEEYPPETWKIGGNLLLQSGVQDLRASQTGGIGQRPILAGTWDTPKNNGEKQYVAMITRGTFRPTMTMTVKHPIIHELLGAARQADLHRTHFTPTNRSLAQAKQLLIKKASKLLATTATCIHEHYGEDGSPQIVWHTGGGAALNSHDRESDDLRGRQQYSQLAKHAFKCMTDLMIDQGLSCATEMRQQLATEAAKRKKPSRMAELATTNRPPLPSWRDTWCDAPALRQATFQDHRPNLGGVSANVF